MSQQTLTTSPTIFQRGSIDPLIPEIVKINAMFTELYAVGPSGATAIEALQTDVTALQEAVGEITGQGVAVADATDADDIVDQFNALLASLRSAGIIATA